MAVKCVICGRNVTQYVTDSDHPKKYVCLKCLGGMVLNEKSVDVELKPIKEAFAKVLGTLKEEWDKQQE